MIRKIINIIYIQKRCGILIYVMKTYLTLAIIIFISIGAVLFFKQNKKFDYQASQAITTSDQEVALVQDSASETPTPTPTPTSIILSGNLPKDCKKDFDCFIEASKSCLSAKVNQEISLKASYLVKGNVDFEIKEVKNGLCNVDFIINSESLSFIPDKNESKEVNDMVENLMDSVQQEMNKNLPKNSLESCSFKTATLTDILTSIKNNKFYFDINGDNGGVVDKFWNNGCGGPSMTLRNFF